MYYDRQWFSNVVTSHGFVAEVFDQWGELSQVSPYRFNVVVRKG